METESVSIYMIIWMPSYSSNIPSRTSRFGKSVRNQADMIADDDGGTGFRLDVSQGHSTLASWSQDSIQTWMTNDLFRGTHKTWHS